MRSEGLASLAIEWAARPGVGAFMSTRAGGVSEGPYGSLNLGDHVGDAPAAVAENRRRLAQAIDATPVWLRQVHGTGVVDAAAARGADAPQADASWTDQPGVACAVLVADCLPVLLAARNVRAVGAVHAGWRGLAAGVIESALAAVAAAAHCRPADVIAWLGPSIGPARYEVGAEVHDAFGAEERARFVPHRSADGQLRWRADLPGLARDRLRQAGVVSVSGGRWCTMDDPSRFFSYRRDGATGRLAAAVWLTGDRRP